MTDFISLPLGIITVKHDYMSDRAVDKFTHNLNVTITDGTCAPRVHSVDVVIFKVLLQEYIFTRPMYKYEISEDQTVPHVIDCFKNLYNHTGVYRLKFSNSTCFSLSSTGKLLKDYPFVLRGVVFWEGRLAPFSRCLSFLQNVLKSIYLFE